MVQLLILLLTLNLSAKVDKTFSEAYVGEKDLEGYAGVYQPLVFKDLYKGKLSFEDEIFFQNYFQNYLFSEEKNYSLFLRSELPGGILCPNELLSAHYDEMRYDYRLITLSYLIEAQWHLKLYSDHFKFKDGCSFDLERWLKTCRPVSDDMKALVRNLSAYAPEYDETLPVEYQLKDWLKEKQSKSPPHYSHYKVKNTSDLSKSFGKTCVENEALMTLICSEQDEIYGLSKFREAYTLISKSNLLGDINREGEGQGCLRRFSEVMSPREVVYPGLEDLFPSIEAHLLKKYQDRYPQGRVFFYGAAKEFERRGLKNVFVKKTPLKVAKLDKEPEVEIEVRPVLLPEKKPETVVEKPAIPETKKEIVEITKPQKSAFLQAAEARAQGNLPEMEVDMEKLRYDYVFSLNTINTLSDRLKSFMKREALVEMMTFDKLGTKEGPVPLLFIKYMIDMQEHQGLWNLVSIVGDKFYVSNEIDSTFKPAHEYVQLVNNDETGRQWKLIVLRP